MILMVLWVLLGGAGVISPGAQAADDAIRRAYEAGEAALKQGDLLTARKSFLQVLELSPDDLGARVNLGVVCLRQQDWTHALNYLREAEKRAPNVAGIRLDIGLAEYRKGDYAAAIAPFQSVIRDQPDSQQARHLLGLSYLFTERYSDAALTLEPLWPASQNDLAFLYSLAVAAGNARQLEWEQKTLAQLMVVGKDSALLHLLQGKAYLARENFGQALQEFQLAESLDGKLPLLHYNLGVVYRRKGQLEEARREFESDAAFEPGVAFNYDQLGNIAYSLEDDRSAEAYFKRALALDAGLGTSWFGLAKVDKKEKRFRAALMEIDQALGIDSKSASAHYLKSQILSAVGRNEEAQTELAAVRRLKKEGQDKVEQEMEAIPYRDAILADAPSH